ncbi:MAG: hypothetical protein M3Y85_13135, partial [Bacteroidota bacterium]|nr:hypothetical protein [Bacteroidota bacterium]
VRPSQNILPVLLRERFPLGVKVIFSYLLFTVRIIPKKLYWYVFKYLLNFIFIIVLPIAITAFAIYQTVHHTSTAAAKQNTIWTIVLPIAKNLGFLFLSYIFGRILSMTSVKSPPTLSVYAAEIIAKNPAVEAVLFGHTHDPEQKILGDGKWYFNTGTWIPIFETSSADVREDKTYTFIAIDCKETPPCSERLRRWNDDAARVDQMNLNERK